LAVLKILPLLSPNKNKIPEWYEKGVLPLCWKLYITEDKLHTHDVRVSWLWLYCQIWIDFYLRQVEI
jgi:hypothetical protein